MVWNWRFLKDMRTWCKCIKRIQTDAKLFYSPFNNLKNSNYSYSQVYLGAKGIVNFHSQDIVLMMSYSVRDGILIKIKKNLPYKILFDYVDGAYYVNDDRQQYNHLLKLLSALKEQASDRHYIEIYKDLEELMFDFVTKYCDWN